MSNPLASARLDAARSGLADIEAIFGVPPADPVHASGNVRALGGRAPSAKPASRAGAIGAAVALSLLGVAIGAALSPRRGEPPTPTSAPERELSVELTPQAPVAPPVDVPLTIPSPDAPQMATAAPKAQIDCARPGGRRCSYATVLAADRTLRQAYRRATRAGVSAHELKMFQRSWRDLRPKGARDPDRVVRGYRAMAADLNQLARDRRS